MIGDNFPALINSEIVYVGSRYYNLPRLSSLSCTSSVSRADETPLVEAMQHENEKTLHTITPERALYFTKLSVMLTAIWPPERDADEFKVKLANVLWCSSVVSGVCLLLPLLASAHTYKDDPVILSKSICLACAVSQVIIKAIVCRVHREKLQFLLHELSVYFKEASKHERKLFERYVKERAGFHVMVTLCCYGATVFVISGPIFLPSALPAEAKYPFPVNSSPTWEMIYVHQAIAGFQASAGMCIDCLAAFLLWFTGVRFELLYEKFKYLQSTKAMVQCIREHQFLLRYGSVLAETFRYVIFATVFSVTAGLAFAGIYLFSPQPIFVKGQFVVVSISAGINLYVTALPSDYLIAMCQKLSDVVYDSLWIKNCPGISRNWVCIIQRAHKPIAIRIPGLIKELSLQYYFSVLSSTFSYFTALHVILTKESE